MINHYSLLLDMSPLLMGGAKARSDALERHVRNTCKRLKFPKDRIHKAMQYMYYDDPRKVIYCFIPKVRYEKGSGPMPNTIHDGARKVIRFFFFQTIEKVLEWVSGVSYY